MTEGAYTLQAVTLIVALLVAIYTNRMGAKKAKPHSIQDGSTIEREL